MRNSQKIIIVATVFNLLFEYSLRGLNSLSNQPVLPLVLIALYASLYTIQNDLIQRYRLQDYHLLILAFAYGMIYQCLVSGAAFVTPTALGINWSSVLFVILIWWGAIQSVLTFYLANRLVPRDWTAPLLSRRGWAIALAINIAMIFLFQASHKIPVGRPIGYVIMLGISVGASVVLNWVRPRDISVPKTFAPSRVLDGLVFLTVLVFAFSALFLRGGAVVANEASLVNASAMALIPIWSLIVAALLFLYRIITRKAIPV